FTFLFSKFKDVLRLLLVEGDSDEVVIGLAISLPLNLIDALIWWKMLVLMVVQMICKILVLDNKDLDIVEQLQQVLMAEVDAVKRKCTKGLMLLVKVLVLLVQD
nr:hypothetical protein [Tanacetum cinerariifolium]